MPPSADLIDLIDLIELLAGRWTVERTMRDTRRDVAGAFSGQADFAPAPGGGLMWTERGRMRYGAHDGPASRTLAIVGGPGAWMVEFDDGRPFHPLDLSSGACAVDHLCGEDLYRGEYRLAGRHALDVRWRVTGPRKRDEIVSAYRRQA